jgi:Cadherin domain
VTINDVGSSTATATSTATIADAPLTPTPVALSGVEGTAIAATVATFTDANPNALPSDFSAIINWGDGTTSAGTIVAQNGGGFAVTGPHTYVDEGSYLTTVAINDVGGSTTTATSTATIADADVLSGQGVNVGASVNQALNNIIVAKFTDAYAGSQAGDFTATINWGDGTISTGTVSGGNGSFAVSGSHTYTAAGQDSVTVTLAELAPGNAVGTTSSTIQVIGGPPEIVSDGGGDTASIIITDHTKFVDVVHATDPNPDASINYSIVGGANQKLFTIDPKSGALSFKSDPVDGKTYQVKVAASDGTSQDTQTINVKVANGAFEFGNPGVADTFVFKPHFGLAIVNGFDPSSSNHDVIEFDQSLFKGATAGESGNAALKLVADHSFQLGHDLFVFTDAKDVIDLRDTNIHNLTSHDFIIA